ncbi:MAG: DNA-binding response regulator [Lachnospiraceae bacterium]|nr:DNA-binding response regulator [Lachnospiraceae bacterium]
MDYRILIVEDDRGIAEGISEQMKQWGYGAKCVSDFHNVMGEFAEYMPHLILMDISLPFMSGYHWCSEIRKVSSVPVIFVSSASDNMNIVMAVNMGADDFIAKPFDQNVLTAKVQALLRRSYDFALSSPIIEYRGLMQNRGKIVSREKLMESLWEGGAFVDENTLTVNVGRLRKKLENAGIHDLIATRSGVGYTIG